MNARSFVSVLSVGLLNLAQVAGLPEVARSQLPEQSVKQPDIAVSALRYDGLYVAKVVGKDYTYYLRFYPDATVTTTLSTGNPVQVAAWLKRDGNNSTTSYALSANNTEIKFTELKPSGPAYDGPTIVSQGTIHKDKLRLQVESSNNSRQLRTYEFVPVQFPDLISSQQLTDSKVGIMFKSALESLPGNLNIGNVVQRQIAYEETQRELGIEYIDRCPKGSKAVGYSHITDYGRETISNRPVPPVDVGRSEARAWFVSRMTVPAPGLRVVVRNLSQAAAENTPYTDREYNQGQRSEDFIVALGDRHHSKFLSLNPGINQLSYEIKRGDQVLESGQFTAKVTQSTMQSTRIVTIPRAKHELDCVKTQ